jgi:hypothetical protein
MRPTPANVLRNAAFAPNFVCQECSIRFVFDKKLTRMGYISIGESTLRRLLDLLLDDLAIAQKQT